MGIHKGDSLMSLRSLLVSRCDIQSQTRIRDALGGWSTAWMTTYRDLPCRIQPLSGQERVLYDRQAVKATHKMFCEVKTINEGMRVKFNSLYYDIVSVENTDEMNHHLRIILVLTK